MVVVLYPLRRVVYVVEALVEVWETTIQMITGFVIVVMVLDTTSSSRHVPPVEGLVKFRSASYDPVV